ncbi:FecR domain-containing protein [Phenylobacterium sp.]|uniref:FecR family protein n=1 Tax=Phenylobacterium sp. TaxID=1871053 RepID=UPI00198CEEFA|nr:FecR domain-containing protein [Phenylobacterium sp.]MBC7166370.1 FecR domain-containing protein [Phenylobacterium sp.]
MSPLTQSPSRLPRESAAEIEAAAAVWAARVDRGPLAPEEQSALDAWAAADPRRAGAYARAMAANAYFDQAAALGPNLPADAAPAWTRRRTFAAAGGAIAASLFGVVGANLLWTRGRIATPKGDVRRISLPEGSAVTLNTDTAIRPDFSASERRVELLRGEALFDVAHDPSRPFRVVADGVSVEAIGTSFTVRRHEDGAVEVIVRQGLVDVRRVGAASGLRLPAATASRVDSDQPILAKALSPEAVDKAMAWREGRLDLTGKTLAAAAAEFARYSDYEIRFEDPALGRLEVSGVYSISDPEGFARAAALSLGLVAEPGAGGVLISASAAS